MKISGKTVLVSEEWEGGTALSSVYFGLIIHSDSTVSHHKHNGASPAIAGKNNSIFSIVWSICKWGPDWVGRAGGRAGFQYWIFPVPVFPPTKTVKFNALFSSSNPQRTICCSLHLWWTTITHHTEQRWWGLILKIEKFVFLWPWDVSDYVVMFFCHIPMTGWHFHLHRSRQTSRNWVPAEQTTTDFSPLVLR